MLIPNMRVSNQWSLGSVALGPWQAQCGIIEGTCGREGCSPHSGWEAKMGVLTSFWDRS